MKTRRIASRSFPASRTRRSLILATALFSALVLAASCGGGGGGGGAPAGGGGNGGGGGGVVDTTPPSISINSLQSATPYPIDNLPTRITFSWSDNAAINPASFDASFTLGGYALNITDLFTADASGAVSNDTDPLGWMPVVCASGYNFSGASVLGRASRNNAAAVRISPDASPAPRFYVWNNASPRVAVMPADGTAGAVETLPFSPLALAPAGTIGKVFALRPSEAAVYVFDANMRNSRKITGLPDFPKTIAFNPAAPSRLYVGYANRQGLGLIDASAETFADLPAATGFIPALLSVRPTGDGEAAVVATTTASLSSYRFLRINSSGTVLQNVNLGGDLPIDADWVGSDDAYFSIFASASVTWLRVSTGAAQRIAVGYAPTDLFPDAGRIFVVNSGDSSLTAIDAASQTAGSALRFSSAIRAGAWVQTGAASRYCLIQDVWDFSSSAVGTLSVSIRDAAGNRSSASIQLRFSTGGPPAPRFVSR